MRSSTRAKRRNTWKEDYEFHGQIAELRAKVYTAALMASDDVAQRITRLFRQELRAAFKRQITRQKIKSGYPMASMDEESNDALYNSLMVELTDAEDMRFIGIQFGEGLPYAANLNLPVGKTKRIDKTPGTRGLMVPNRKNFARGNRVPRFFIQQSVQYPGTGVFDIPYQKTLTKLDAIKIKAIEEAQAALLKKGIDFSVSSTGKTISVKDSDFAIRTKGKGTGNRIYNVRDPKTKRFTKRTR